MSFEHNNQKISNMKRPYRDPRCEAVVPDPAAMLCASLVGDNDNEYLIYEEW